MEKKVSGQLLVSLQQKNSLKCGNQSQVLLYLNSGFMVSTALRDMLQNVVINLIFVTLTPSYYLYQTTKSCKTHSATLRPETSSTCAWALLHIPITIQTATMPSPHPYTHYTEEMLSIK